MEVLECIHGITSQTMNYLSKSFSSSYIHVRAPATQIGTGAEEKLAVSTR